MEIIDTHIVLGTEALSWWDLWCAQTTDGQTVVCSMSEPVWVAHEPVQFNLPRQCHYLFTARPRGSRNPRDAAAWTAESSAPRNYSHVINASAANLIDSLIYNFRFHRHHCVSRTITPNIIRFKWVQLWLQINRSGWWSYRRNSCLPLRLTTAFAVIDRNIWNSLVRIHILAQASFIRYMWEGILKTIFRYSKIQK